MLPRKGIKISVSKDAARESQNELAIMIPPRNVTTKGRRGSFMGVIAEGHALESASSANDEGCRPKIKQLR